MYKPILATISICLCANVWAQSLPAAKTKPKGHNGVSTRARIVEDVPPPNAYLTQNFIRVRAEQTPSGYPVPRFVSLKYGKANGRTGPGKSYPVKWQYKRAGLPMIVVAETETWRKVRDVSGDESWMNRRLLDGKKMVLVRADVILRAKARSDSKGRAIVAKGALLALENCQDNRWCRVKDEDSGQFGYVLATMLWGAGPL